ncbi:methyltransferase domain-containing protein [Bacillus sp. 7586-K]|uniref:methyltransferase domain-containing protein n=1 Tax=Metabacillus niabensis TaxID=324854 RepID=UPI001481FE45
MGKISIDRVNEAYYGDLGTDFSNKTRERVNWIVTHVAGKKILDIGCSQGIVSILLGREGKKIDAIDISSESIDYAKKELEKEHASVQETVNFRVVNFMTEPFDNDYDTVLLTEVIEHISDPKSFLEKVSQTIKPDGKLIITVPFGINDFIDHKRTYYYSALVEQLKDFFYIEEFTYLGKWAGVICKMKTEETPSYYNKQAVKDLEQAFYHVEREYINRIKSDLEQMNDLKSQLKTKTEEIDEVSELKIVNKSLKNTINEKENLIRQLQIETVELLNREETALKAALVKQNKIDELNRQISVLEHRYKVIRKSRFGRVQVKYWELKRRLKKIVGRGKK